MHNKARMGATKPKSAQLFPFQPKAEREEYNVSTVINLINQALSK